MAFYLGYLLAFYLTFYLASLLAFYLAVEVQRCTLSWAGPRLRSSGAHWAGKVPGWGPAVHTELGRSQVEVQQCTLSWAGPRVHTELGRSQVEVQRCTLSSDVGEELGEELARQQWTWKWRQRRRRRRRRRTRRRRTTALIKSNNPHLAGGEKLTCHRFDILLPAGITIRKAAGAAGYTTPIKVAEAVVQAVEYEPWLWMGWGQCQRGQ